MMRQKEIPVRLIAIIGALGIAAGLFVARGGAAPGGPTVATGPAPAGLAKATFAGGCFWCMETAYEGVPGVVSVTSGYTGGPEQGPSYEQVSSHGTGHAEAVQVVFDPKKVTYERLLTIFWHNVDPTNDRGQFCDFGHQYRTGIFVHDAAQRRLAEASKQAIEKTKPFAGPVLTAIEDAGPFWRAEEYHQDFYKKDPVRYHSYRLGCGRDRRLQELWGAQAGKD
jgi:peptide-methionine (S)-S-oxide reductase